MKRRRFLQGAACAWVCTTQATEVTATLRRLRFTYTFSNPFNYALKEQRFWAYLPATLAPTQRLRHVHVSMPHQVQNDEWGHNILALSFDHLAPWAQKVVTVTSEIELSSGEPSPQTLPDPNVWLSPERFIESDDARIRALAAELQRDTALDTAHAIYTWVKNNLRYAGYLAEELGAVQALINRRGDCTEYGDLVVALARANGIPARRVGGYVTTQDATPKPNDYHDWSELFLDGGWRVADAQKENWLASPTHYISFSGLSRSAKQRNKFGASASGRGADDYSILKNSSSNSPSVQKRILHFSALCGIFQSGRSAKAILKKS